MPNGSVPNEPVREADGLPQDARHALAPAPLGLEPGLGVGLKRGLAPDEPGRARSAVVAAGLPAGDSRRAFSAAGGRAGAGPTGSTPAGAAAAPGCGGNAAVLGAVGCSPWAAVGGPPCSLAAAAVGAGGPGRARSAGPISPGRGGSAAVFAGRPPGTPGMPGCCCDVSGCGGCPGAAGTGRLAPSDASPSSPRGGPATGACAAAGLISGGRSITGACCNAAGVTCAIAGATGSALAKTRCGTTVANRRLANVALASCGGRAPFGWTMMLLTFLTLVTLRLRI